jgi:hypothetical protein
MSEVRQAALLCSAVSEGDLQLLKRLLAAGANPNAGDYDKRRPLHIAAADGNLPAVRRRGLRQDGSDWGLAMQLLYASCGPLQALQGLS